MQWPQHKSFIDNVLVAPAVVSESLFGCFNCHSLMCCDQRWQCFVDGQLLTGINCFQLPICYRETVECDDRNTRLSLTAFLSLLQLSVSLLLVVSIVIDWCAVTNDVNVLSMVSCRQESIVFDCQSAIERQLNALTATQDFHWQRSCRSSSCPWVSYWLFQMSKIDVLWPAMSMFYRWSVVERNQLLSIANLL